VGLISDVLPFGRLWYREPDDAIGYAKFFSRSHYAVIRAYYEAGNVIETHVQPRCGEGENPGSDQGTRRPIVELIADFHFRCELQSRLSDRMLTA
jgi:hypothetical protein